MSDNANIDEMSDMSYKIDLDIINTSRNKRKIEEVDNQIGKVISNLVDKVKESLTQKLQLKKCYGI